MIEQMRHEVNAQPQKAQVYIHTASRLYKSQFKVLKCFILSCNRLQFWIVLWSLASTVALIKVLTRKSMQLMWWMLPQLEAATVCRNHIKSNILSNTDYMQHIGTDSNVYNVHLHSNAKIIAKWHYHKDCYSCGHSY